MMLAASWCRAAKTYALLRGERHVQCPGADQGQQPRRQADQHRPGGPLGAGEAADVGDQALAVGCG